MRQGVWRLYMSHAEGYIYAADVWGCPLLKGSFSVKVDRLAPHSFTVHTVQGPCLSRPCLTTTTRIAGLSSHLVHEACGQVHEVTGVQHTLRGTRLQRACRRVHLSGVNRHLSTPE